jgi:hypothetical protein
MAHFTSVWWSNWNGWAFHDQSPAQKKTITDMFLQTLMCFEHFNSMSSDTWWRLRLLSAFFSFICNVICLTHNTLCHCKVGRIYCLWGCNIVTFYNRVPATPNNRGISLTNEWRYCLCVLNCCSISTSQKGSPCAVLGLNVIIFNHIYSLSLSCAHFNLEVKVQYTMWFLCAQKNTKIFYLYSIHVLSVHTTLQVP